MDILYTMAHIHCSGAFKLLPANRESLPGSDYLCRLLPQLNQPSFQFLPLQNSTEYYAAICCQAGVHYDDDDRPGSMAFAFVFTRQSAYALLRQPVYLRQLIEYMRALQPRQVLTLLKSRDVPLELPVPASYTPKQSLISSMMRNIVVRCLSGETCYAFVDGDFSNLLNLLCSLPLSVRQLISFTYPYTADYTCQTGLFSFVPSVRSHFPGLPTARRYNIADGETLPPLSGHQTYLSNVLTALTKNAELDKAFCCTASFSDWGALADHYRLMSSALEDGDQGAAQKLLRDAPDATNLLLCHCPETVLTQWQELISPHRSSTSSRAAGSRRRRESPFMDRFCRGNKLAVGILLAFIALSCLIFGSRVTATAARIYFTIHCDGSDLLKLLLGGLFGLGIGYLVFGKGDDT